VVAGRLGSSGGRTAAPVVGWWLLTWFDVETEDGTQPGVPFSGGVGGVGALLGPERTTALMGGGFSLGSHCRAPVSVWWWWSAGVVVKCRVDASIFFLDLLWAVHAPWCVRPGLLDDCVAGVGVLVKLSRAHGGCLGIRSR
jgi:hypothetical protein